MEPNEPTTPQPRAGQPLLAPTDPPIVAVPFQSVAGPDNSGSGPNCALIGIECRRDPAPSRPSEPSRGAPVPTNPVSPLHESLPSGAGLSSQVKLFTDIPEPSTHASERPQTSVPLAPSCAGDLSTAIDGNTAVPTTDRTKHSSGTYARSSSLTPPPSELTDAQASRLSARTLPDRTLPTEPSTAHNQLDNRTSKGDPQGLRTVAGMITGGDQDATLASDSVTRPLPSAAQSTSEPASSPSRSQAQSNKSMLNSTASTGGDSVRLRAAAPDPLPLDGDKSAPAPGPPSKKTETTKAKPKTKPRKNLREPGRTDQNPGNLSSPSPQTSSSIKASTKAENSSSKRNRSPSEADEKRPSKSKAAAASGSDRPSKKTKSKPESVSIESPLQSDAGASASASELETCNEVTKEKRTYAAVACVNCRQSKLACDEHRPCLRCIRRGLRKYCVDIQPKKRGRKRTRGLNPHPNTVSTKAEIVSITEPGQGPASKFIVSEDPSNAKSERMRAVKPQGAANASASSDPFSAALAGPSTPSTTADSITTSSIGTLGSSVVAESSSLSNNAAMVSPELLPRIVSAGGTPVLNPFSPGLGTLSRPLGHSGISPAAMLGQGDPLQLRALDFLLQSQQKEQQQQQQQQLQAAARLYEAQYQAQMFAQAQVAHAHAYQQAAEQLYLQSYLSQQQPSFSDPRNVVPWSQSPQLGGVDPLNFLQSLQSPATSNAFASAFAAAAVGMSASGASFATPSPSQPSLPPELLQALTASNPSDPLNQLLAGQLMARHQQQQQQSALAMAIANQRSTQLQGQPMASSPLSLLASISNSLTLPSEQETLSQIAKAFQQRGAGPQPQTLFASDRQSSKDATADAFNAASTSAPPAAGSAAQPSPSVSVPLSSSTYVTIASAPSVSLRQSGAFRPVKQ